MLVSAILIFITVVFTFDGGLFEANQIIFEDEIYDLVDPAGNRYVMHATAGDAPNLEPGLPAGTPCRQQAVPRTK